jgi:hypothetical protein
VFNYYLKDANDSSGSSVTILDKQNKPIRSFSRTAKETANKIDFNNGMNQFVWDMNYEPVERPEGFILWNGGVGSAKAAPGRYSARFRYGRDSVEVPFVIRADPNYNATEADYDAQVGFLLQVRDKFSECRKPSAISVHCERS